MSRFEGRAVVVTGGSRGIGFGIAEAFARAGARVLVIGRSDRVAGAAARALTESSARPVRHLAADLGSAEACRVMAAHAEEVLGGIDVLCLSAGIYPEHLLTDMTEEDFDQVMDVNVKASVFSVQACAVPLARTSSGRVVLVSSITGPFTGWPGWSHYGASKAAQLGFMRSAALELAGSGTTVNAVAPGSISTDSFVRLAEEERHSIVAAVPLGRVGTVADVAAACLFLASEEAAFITGQTLVVDGGQTLPELPMATLRA